MNRVDPRVLLLDYSLRRGVLPGLRTHPRQVPDAPGHRHLPVRHTRSGYPPLGGDPVRVFARARYDQALVLATEVGMHPLVAHCHLGLGKLYRRTGDGVTAEEHLQTATTMYREMDMRFWLELIEAEMKVTT